MTVEMAFRGALLFKDRRVAQKALAALGGDEVALGPGEVTPLGRQLTIECFTSAPASWWEPTCAALEALASTANGGHLNAQCDAGEGEAAILRLRYHPGGREEELDGPFDDDDMQPPAGAEGGGDLAQALHLAALEGDEPRVRALLDRGVPPEAALWGAAAHPRLTALLLERGVAARGDLARKRSPLCIAARGRSAEALRLWLAAGAGPDEREEKGGMTALMYAAEHAEPALVKVLLEHGADPNARDAQGNTALLHAAFLGNAEALDVAAALAGAKADTELENADGETVWDRWARCRPDVEALRQVVAAARRRAAKVSPRRGTPRRAAKPPRRRR